MTQTIDSVRLPDPLPPCCGMCKHYHWRDDFSGRCVFYNLDEVQKHSECRGLSGDVNPRQAAETTQSVVRRPEPPVATGFCKVMGVAFLIISVALGIGLLMAIGDSGEIVLSYLGLLIGTLASAALLLAAAAAVEILHDIRLGLG
jgi:hypothetical protein